MLLSIKISAAFASLNQQVSSAGKKANVAGVKERKTRVKADVGIIASSRSNNHKPADSLEASLEQKRFYAKPVVNLGLAGAHAAKKMNIKAKADVGILSSMNHRSLNECPPDCPSCSFFQYWYSLEQQDSQLESLSGEEMLALCQEGTIQNCMVSQSNKDFMTAVFCAELECTSENFPEEFSERVFGTDNSSPSPTRSPPTPSPTDRPNVCGCEIYRATCDFCKGTNEGNLSACTLYHGDLPYICEVMEYGESDEEVDWAPVAQTCEAPSRSPAVLVDPAGQKPPIQATDTDPPSPATPSPSTDPGQGQTSPSPAETLAPVQSPPSTPDNPTDPGQEETPPDLVGSSASKNKSAVFWFGAGAIAMGFFNEFLIR